jgi:hypothetical protein
MKVTIDVQEFEGYEFVGFKVPANGEWKLWHGALIVSAGSCEEAMVYRKIVKYREPTQADVGKMVEVRDSEHEPWREFELLLVTPSYLFPYVTANIMKNGHFPWRYARIVDDGTPVKAAWTGAGNGKTPREVWVNRYVSGNWGTAWDSQKLADKNGTTSDRTENVHFREVLE